MYITYLPIPDSFKVITSIHHINKIQSSKHFYIDESKLSRIKKKTYIFFKFLNVFYSNIKYLVIILNKWNSF